MQALLTQVENAAVFLFLCSTVHCNVHFRLGNDPHFHGLRAIYLTDFLLGHVALPCYVLDLLFSEGENLNPFTWVLAHSSGSFIKEILRIRHLNQIINCASDSCAHLEQL